MRPIEPKLLELNPKSVIKVYTLIRRYADFDLKYFAHLKKLNSVFNSLDYSLEEKYYLALYLPYYLNYNNPQSYISKKIKEIEDLGEPENIQVVNDIEDYAKSLTTTCKTNLTKYKRRYDKFIKSKINLDKEEGKISSKIHGWEKLPIEKEVREEFLEIINSELKEFYSEEMIKTIINNSFTVLPFDEDIRFLDMEYENSGDIYIAFGNICREYRKINPRQVDIVNSYQKKLSKKMKKLKSNNEESIRNFFMNHKSTEQYMDASTTLNFAKIMFVTFSKIRENFILNKKHIFIEDYLENSVCKNL